MNNCHELPCTLQPSLGHILAHLLHKHKLVNILLFKRNLTDSILCSTPIWESVAGNDSGIVRPVKVSNGYVRSMLGLFDSLATSFRP